MSYFDTYLRRLNNDGKSYQERLQKKRERLFEKQLDKSIYKVSFEIDNNKFVGELTPYKQDETKTLQYLLTPLSTKIPSGTIITPKLVDKNGDELTDYDEGAHWMIYWFEKVKASGYNRYVVLRMTHFLTWKDRDGIARESWAYFFGQKNNMLKDELKSRSRDNAVYTENLKLSFYILPRNEYIKKDDYFVVGEAPFEEAYVVTGMDIQSTPGVEYVSVDPQPIRDTTPAPEKKEEDNDDDFYWINGGQ